VNELMGELVSEWIWVGDIMVDVAKKLLGE